MIDEFLKNNQNEYIESEGKFANEKCWGIGVKKAGSKYLKFRNYSDLISKRTVYLRFDLFFSILHKANESFFPPFQFFGLLLFIIGN